VKYSMEQRRVAVETYVRFDCCGADTIRELGYPRDRKSLRSWYLEWKAEQDDGQAWDRGQRSGRYTDGQKQAAVDFYVSHGRRIARTIRHMGYPTHQLLATWIDELAPGQRRSQARQVPHDQRSSAVRVLVVEEKTSGEVAENAGVHPATVRGWKRSLTTGVRVSDQRIRSSVADSTGGTPLGSGDVDSRVACLEEENRVLRERIRRLTSPPQALRKELRELEVEVDILTTTKELLGKEAGTDPANLSASEKTILIRHIHHHRKISVSSLTARLRIARSLYYYHLKVMDKPDKDVALVGLIREAFTASHSRYGYRRVCLELRSAGIRVGAKRVMRLMSAHQIVPVFKSSRRYSSYKGEVSKAPDNIVNRDFHADQPNKLWVTDVTEFHAGGRKVYLSPIIDCFDGMPVSWTMSTSPNAAMANRMLENACQGLQDGQVPIIHSDRGCHYRWPGWISICSKYGLTRSMSAKGCSPDNAAAEGFFGRLKQEFYHKRDYTHVTVEEFMALLDEYMWWYRDTRIKTAYATSITARRHQLGLMA
jgi:putative transposase